jgi:hypothetical protein
MLPGSARVARSRVASNSDISHLDSGTGPRETGTAIGYQRVALDPESGLPKVPIADRCTGQSALPRSPPGSLQGDPQPVAATPLMGALLRCGQPGEVGIDAHLQNRKRQWRHLVDVDVPELLKGADVLLDARPKAPDRPQDR